MIRSIAIKPALALGLFALTTTVSAQIPVTDVANITQDAVNQAANIAQYIAQVEQLKIQVQQELQQYQALTGSRNLGDIFNDPKYRQYLPADWQKVYDQVKSGGYSGLTGTAKGIYKDNQIYDSCAAIQVADQKTVCEQEATKPAIDQGMAMDAYNTATGRLDQIEQLTKQINSTQDPKAIAELQGRIATEQAAIQNEQTKLQLYQMVADAQSKIQQQRQREINLQAAARRGYVQPQPLQVTIGGAQ
ncbi:MAG: P-type DNA transfer protein VirB5 [Edaphobacter sp.]